MMNHTETAARINAAHAAGHRVIVDGHPVYSPYQAPAHVYMTGSLSVNVKAKKPGNRVNVIWYKIDRPAPIVEIEEKN